MAWLFSDTWIGKVRDGKREEATLVNNTVGIQKSRLAPLDYGSTDRAHAHIVPADGRGWFWQQAAGFANGKLYRFLNQLEKSGDPGAFGFRSVGLWLGVTSNADEEPSRWRTRQIKLSNTVFEGALATCSKLRVTGRPSEACLQEIAAFEEILHVDVVALPNLA